MTTLCEIGLPHWIERHYGLPFDHTCRYRISLVTELEWEHQQGHTYGRSDRLVEIDASIAPIVVALNERGHRTLFSCSGLPEDHENEMPSHPKWGYLCFVEPLPEELIPKGMEVSWDGSHIKLPFAADKARLVWAEMARRLGVELV